MKKYIIATLVLICSFSARAQFNNTDTLRAFINHWIRNSAVEAFQNLRLNTALIGLTNFADSSYGGQVRSFTAVNDTTARLITINYDTFSILLRGNGITALRRRPGTDSVEYLKNGGSWTFAFKDSMGTGAPSGPAGGDLTGTYPNPTIASNAITTTKINNGAVTIPKINAIGTADNTTVLWGDGRWAAPGGASAFSSLSDVTVSSPKNGQIPVYDSVTSKWKNKQAVYFNVKDYGAVGDSTTDDRAAIIKARDAAYAGGGVLFFPAGKYRISDSILFNHSIRIQGVAKSGGLHNFQSGGTLEKDRLGPVETSSEIVITDGKNGFVFDRQATTEIKAVLHVENITMSSTVAPGSATVGAFIVVRGMIQDVVIQNNTFYGGYIQVDIQSGYYETVAYNHFSAPRIAGLKVGNNIRTDTGDFLVLGNVFNSGTFNTGSDSTRAVWWHSGGGMKFISNKIDAAEFSTAHAFVYSVYVANIIDPTSDIIIQGNSIENWAITAVYMRGIVSPYIRNILITSNQFAPVSSTGPAIDINSLETVVITDFQCRDWGGTVSAPAIKVTNCTGVVIGKGHIRNYTSNFDVTGSTDVHIDDMWGGDFAVGSTSTNIAGLNTSLYTTETIQGRATSGTNGSGILELTTQTPDADGKDLGYANFVDPSNTSSGIKRDVIIGAISQGTTANDRGGKFLIYTKADGGGISQRFSIDNIGKLTLGSGYSGGTITGTPAYSLAVTSSGDVITTSGGGGSSQWTTSGSNIYFDGTSSGKVGIGTATTPSTKLHIKFSNTGSDGLIVENTNNGVAAQPIVRLLNDAGELGQFGMMSSTHATLPNYTLFEATKSLQFGTDQGVSSGGSAVINFVTGGYSSSPSLQIKGTGNVLVNTTTDNSSGAKLQVNGNATVSDDAYDATTWNGNNEVPTKNAVRDKMETVLNHGSVVVINDADHTVSSTESAIRYHNNITASRTLTIPNPSAAPDREIWVKWNTISGGGSLNITTTSGTALIYLDGTASSSTYNINASNQGALLKSDGTSWYKINGQ